MLVCGSDYGYSSELRPALAPLLPTAPEVNKSWPIPQTANATRQSTCSVLCLSELCRVSSFSFSFSLFFCVVFSVEATATGQRLTLTKLALISFRQEFSKSAKKVNFIDSKREILFEKLLDFKLVQRELYELLKINLYRKWEIFIYFSHLMWSSKMFPACLFNKSKDI